MKLFKSVLLLLLLPTLCYGQLINVDTVLVHQSKIIYDFLNIKPYHMQDWRFYWINAPVGYQIYAPGDRMSQKNDMSLLEGKLFLTIGSTVVRKINKHIGICGSVLFYTNDRSVYPILGIGIMTYKDKFSIQGMWDCGKNDVDINLHEHVYQRRVKVGLFYHFKILL